MPLMSRRWLTVVVFSCAQSCTCGKPTGPAPDAAPTPDKDTGCCTSASPFSLPIAAAVASDGAVWVAGFVAERRAVVLERHQEGRITWTTELASKVDWTPDLELRVLPDASGGAAVVARVLRAAERTRELRFLDRDGKLSGETIAAGAAVCATRAGIAWAAPVGAKVGVRPWSGGPTEELVLPAEREPVLSCADRRVYVLGEGEADVLVYAMPTSPEGPRKLLLDLDNERERALFTFGDDGLGLLEVAQSGAIRLGRGGAAGPFVWQDVPYKLAQDENLDALDGDAHAAWALVTRDATSRCTGAEAAVDVVVHRFGDGGDKELALGKGACGRDFGPYSVGFAAGAAVFAWAERLPKKTATDAPIGALGWARVRGDTVETHEVPVSADGLVFAGCAAERCYAVTLDRAPGTDGMTPGKARVLPFP